MESKYKQSLIDLINEKDHEKAHYEADCILKNIAIDAAHGYIKPVVVLELIDLYSKIVKYYS